MARHALKTRAGAFALGLLISLGVFAGTFNLFQPASGILVGSPTTYVTTSATSTNVRSLWTGTCNSTTYLRGDGTCQAPPGTGGGTVNSVAQTVPAGFAISGSPVTTTGTLAISYASGQAANKFLATPDGTTGALSLRSIVAGDLPAIDLTTGVTGTLPVANGGTGAATLTANGVLLGNGTSAVSAVALAADNVLRGVTSSAPAATALPSCSSSNEALNYNTSTHVFSCATISAGTGTVTSVAQTVPSVFSITGSPVTTSGTLAIDWATGQTQNRVLASPNGSSGAVSLRALVGADIPQINLGTSGNGGVTGNLPVTNLNGGTGASSSTAWFGDGTWKAVASGAANPSASVGLTAVNGVAGTFMRSDAAPALSQSISPTWTGTHTFSPTSSKTLFNGPSGDFAISGQNANAAGSSYGMEIVAGGNSSDQTLRVQDRTGLRNRLIIRGDGVVSIGNTTDNAAVNFLGSGSITSGGVFLGPIGSSGAPTYSLSGDTNTGIYSEGADLLSFSAGGTRRFQIGATQLYASVPFQPDDGSASTPIYSFNNDPNTGVYSVGADSLGLSTGGTNRVTVGPGVQIGAPTGGDQGSGTINATALYVNGVSVGASSSDTTTASITVSNSGCTGTTATARFVRAGDLVTVRIPQLSCATFNGTDQTISANMTYPAGFAPTVAQQFAGTIYNGNNLPATVIFNTGNSVQWVQNGTPVGLTNAGTTAGGTSRSTTFTYTKN